MNDSEGRHESFETTAFSPHRGETERTRNLSCRLTVDNLGGMAAKKKYVEPGKLKLNGTLPKTDGEITRHIGQRVKVVREAAGWSQSELERRADVAVGIVSRLEGGNARIIGIDTLVRLSEVLYAPLEWLVYGQLLKHRQQLPLFSGDAASLPPVWAMAPGGTRAARRRAKGPRLPEGGVPPRGTIVLPGQPARRKPTKPSGR